MRPKSGRTTYHRDGSVTVWNVFTQTWTRTRHPSDKLLSSLGAERERVIQHTEPWADPWADTDLSDDDDVALFSRRQA